MEAGTLLTPIPGDHQSGLGEYDPAVLDGPEEEVLHELRRLEAAQTDLVLDHLGPVSTWDRLLAIGRGDPARCRFGCEVDTATLSSRRAGFPHWQADIRGLPDRFYRAIWTNGTTMFADLFQLFGEFARLLRDGGRYVCLTNCYNDIIGGPSAAVRIINDHYHGHLHPRGEYFAALHGNGFVPITVVDLTPLAIPYWELRARSPLRTGIEDAFRTAYRDSSLHHLLIAADRARIFS